MFKATVVVAKLGHFDLWRRSGYGCSFSELSVNWREYLVYQVMQSNLKFGHRIRMIHLSLEWRWLPQDGVEIDIDTLGQFVDTVILEPLSRISGIAEVTSRGGASREIRIALDIDRVADFGLSIAEVVDAIRASSAEVTAGEITEGNRSFTLRTEAISYTPDTAKELVVRTDLRDGRIFNVKLSDIADIELGYKTPSSFRRLNGKPAITFAVLREPASNVVTTLERLKNEVDALNAGVLAEQGLDLRVVYDETVYIGSALDLVQNNIMIGGILAIMVLFFTRVSANGNRDDRDPGVDHLDLCVIAGLGLSINVISRARICCRDGC